MKSVKVDGLTYTYYENCGTQIVVTDNQGNVVNGYWDSQVRTESENFELIDDLSSEDMPNARMTPTESEERPVEDETQNYKQWKDSW